MLRGRVDRAVVVELRGGVLEIGWADKNSPVLMTGPAATVYTGEWPLDEDQDAKD
jgi:diaminopimelate epimerase